MNRIGFFIFFTALVLPFVQGEDFLKWSELPPIPDELGVAGPYTGVHKDVLFVAGGANFPKPVWESDKEWHSEVYGLSLTTPDTKWKTLGQLPRPLGYGSCVSVPEGVVCLGGNDAERVYDSVLLLSVEGATVGIDETLPSLPQPLCYSAAAIVGNHIYVAGGQTGLGLETAQANFWRLDWSKRGKADEFKWEILEAWPGEPRAFPSVVVQNNRLHLLGGRNLDKEGETKFLADVLEFDLSTEKWIKRADIPAPNAAGTAAAFGNSQIAILAGADGSLFKKSDELKDDHPGFPKTLWVYDTAADSWSESGRIPQNQVTTHALPWRDTVILASGEVRPRVRTPAVWKIRLRE